MDTRKPFRSVTGEDEQSTVRVGVEGRQRLSWTFYGKYHIGGKVFQEEGMALWSEGKTETKAYVWEKRVNLKNNK